LIYYLIKTKANEQMNKQLITSALLGLSQAAKCPYGFTSDETSMAEVDQNIKYPSQAFTCPKGAILQTDVNNFHVSDYEDIVRAVIAEYEEIPEHSSANTNHRADFAGCIVRMAGHDFMDFKMEDE
jgi:hypothetical protein